MLEAIVDTPSELPVARVIPRGIEGLSWGLGRPTEELSRALSGLSDKRLVVWDERSGVALLPELFRSQKHWCQSPNHLRAWYRAWADLPRTSKLRYAALVAMRLLVPDATHSQAFSRAWMETFAAPLYEYLVWGGIDPDRARVFSGTLSANEFLSLPERVSTNARRQRDYKNRKRGALTEREDLIHDAEHLLPTEWSGGIAPRLRDCGDEAPPLASDRLLARPSLRSLPPNVASEPRSGIRRMAPPDSLPPVRLNRDRERDLTKEISLSIWDLPVTTCGGDSPVEKLLIQNSTTSLVKSAVRPDSRTGNDSVTTSPVTTEVTTSPVVTESLPARETGSPETHFAKNSHFYETRVKYERSGPRAGRSDAGGAVPYHLTPKVRFDLHIQDRRQAREFAEADRRWREESLRAAEREEAERPSERREGRRPRGVAPAPSAGALAALSGWHPK